MTDDQQLRIKCLRLAASYHEDPESALQWARQFYDFVRGHEPDDGFGDFLSGAMHAADDEVEAVFPDMTAAKQAVAKQAAYEAERKAHKQAQREADMTELRGVILHCGPSCRAGFAEYAGLKCDCGELEAIKASVGKAIDANGERG